jgi:hypothetical protein
VTRHSFKLIGSRDERQLRILRNLLSKSLPKSWS